MKQVLEPTFDVSQCRDPIIPIVREDASRHLGAASTFGPPCSHLHEIKMYLITKIIITSPTVQSSCHSRASGDAILLPAYARTARQMYSNLSRGL